jgi:site-specific DNA recombinase
MDYHYNMKVKNSDVVKKLLLEQIEEANRRMAKVRELLINTDIEPSDYRLIKQDGEQKFAVDEQELLKVSANHKGIEALMLKLSNTLGNIDILYAEADIDGKRETISTLFPEKLEIENSGYRTPKVNEVAAFIYMLNTVLA